MKWRRLHIILLKTFFSWYFFDFYLLIFLVQIFDLSFNRIRELNTKSFARYTDIKFLYLFENMIRVIQKNSFASLKQLEAIDLSTNVLTTIPAELFALPKLRNLHIVDNHLIDLPGDLQVNWNEFSCFQTKNNNFSSFSISAYSKANCSSTANTEHGQLSVAVDSWFWNSTKSTGSECFQ